VQIEGDIESARAEATCPGPVVSPAWEAGSLWDDQDLVEMGVAADNRFGQRFGEIREVRVRKAPSQGPDERRREDHVAQQPEAKEENSAASVHRPVTRDQLRLDGRFVD
jgi:hypothetical protein